MVKGTLIAFYLDDVRFAPQIISQIKSQNLVIEAQNPLSS